MIWFFVLLFAAMLVLGVIGICLDPGGGSWVKEDGTIIEWDGDGHGRVLHPDGKLEKF